MWKCLALWTETEFIPLTNMLDVNCQLLTIEAAVTGKREHVYQAAMLDPHTGAELSIDDIISMCDELIEAHTKAGYPVL